MEFVDKTLQEMQAAYMAKLTPEVQELVLANRQLKAAKEAAEKDRIAKIDLEFSLKKAEIRVLDETGMAGVRIRDAMIKGKSFEEAVAEWRIEAARQEAERQALFAANKARETAAEEALLQAAGELERSPSLPTHYARALRECKAAFLKAGPGTREERDARSELGRFIRECKRLISGHVEFPSMRSGHVI